MTRRLLLLSLFAGLGLLGLSLALLPLPAPAQGVPRSLLNEPTWGPDIKVNPTLTPPARIMEASSRVDPADANNVIAGYLSEALTSTSGYSWSTDAGRTWGSGTFQDPWYYQGNPLISSGDVRVAFDSTGVGYYTSQALGQNYNGYFVLTTTNGSAWSTPVPVVATDYNEHHDQSSLAVDPRTTGPYAKSVYVGWMYSNNIGVSFHGIWVRYSRDSGQTWSSDIEVSDPEHEYAGIGPSVKVAPNGTVYLAFDYLEANDIANPPRYYLDRSTDGGVTWGTDLPVAGGAAVQIGRPDFKGRELTLVGSNSGGSCSLIHVNNFPLIAVSPNDPNTVYATWNDGRWEGLSDLCGAQGRHSDIAFSRSTDGGVTWTEPMRLNDDPQGNGVDQWQPAIDVKADGLIGVTWYDRRYDPNGVLYDTVYTQSTDGGVTWSANRRVSDVSSNPDNLPDFKGVDDLGERKDIAFGPDYVLPFWVDTRNGKRVGDLYTDRGEFPTSITPTPTSTPPSETVTPTSTPPSETATPTVTSTPCTINFSDVNPPDYFYVPVQYLYCHGAISGYADGTFRPYNNTTRGQLTKIVVLAEGWPLLNPPTPTFTDVPPSNPFYQYIETAYNHSIISGYADGTFRWGNNVTRGQLCKIVVLAEGWTLINPPTPTFTDVPPSNPFYQYIETAYSHSIISGYADGTFRPGNNATRGQIAKIVYLAVTGN